MVQRMTKDEPASGKGAMRGSKMFPLFIDDVSSFIQNRKSGEK